MEMGEEKMKTIEDSAGGHSDRLLPPVGGRGPRAGRHQRTGIKPRQDDDPLRPGLLRTLEDHPLRQERHRPPGGFQSGRYDRERPHLGAVSCPSSAPSWWGSPNVLILKAGNTGHNPSVPFFPGTEMARPSGGVP